MRRVMAVLAVVLGVLVAAPPLAGEAATGYSLQTATLLNKVLLMRWNPCQTDITYMVNTDALPLARRYGALTDVKTAFARVATATGMRFRYAGTTHYLPSGSRWSNATYAGGEPAEIVVGWASSTHPSTLLSTTNTAVAGIGGSAIKAVSTSRYGVVGYVGRGYVLLSAPVDPRLTPGYGSGVTRGELLLHEIGHVIGLGHTSLSSQIMYPSLLWRSAAAYGTYDRYALYRMGRGGGCYPVALWQDLS